MTMEDYHWRRVREEQPEPHTEVVAIDIFYAKTKIATYTPGDTDNQGTPCLRATDGDDDVWLAWWYPIPPLPSIGEDLVDGTCEDCGSAEGFAGECPFDADVHGMHTPVVLCEVCYELRADEI